MLEENRRTINLHHQTVAAARISLPHIIAWAIVAPGASRAPRIEGSPPKTLCHSPWLRNAEHVEVLCRHSLDLDSLRVTVVEDRQRAAHESGHVIEVCRLRTPVEVVGVGIAASLDRVPLDVAMSITRRSGSGYGRPRSSMASTRLKIAVLAPMPMARTRTATTVNPGLAMG